MTLLQKSGGLNASHIKNIYEESDSLETFWKTFETSFDIWVIWAIALDESGQSTDNTIPA